MRTKTNFNAIQELMAKYTPKQKNIVTDQETDLIRSVLELESRDLFELNDIRDMAVAIYGQAASTAEKEHGLQAMMDMMDAMSAVTAVIDTEKAARVCPDDEKTLLAMSKTCIEPICYAVMDDNGHFMTTSTKTPFSPDPKDARTGPRAADAGVMANYAKGQFKKDMSVASIRTGHVICHVLDPAAEDMLNRKEDDSDGSTDI